MALGLTVGFYVMSLGIALALLYLAYATVRSGMRVPVRLLAIQILGAGIILWSIFPRLDRFTAPGIRLTPERAPALFQHVQEIADKTGQKMPEDIFLVFDVNAFVAERGGFLGIGGRRIMGVGLPLLSGITIPQFKAVVAHEFGHFYGGDTKLRPWVYNTRSAIIRTVRKLSSINQMALIEAPFRWYATNYLRITHAVSRHQEYTADSLSAKTVGGKHLIEALKSVSGISAVFNNFLHGEYSIALNAGYQPPFHEGFSQFLAEENVAQSMRKLVAAEMDNPNPDPYDTHPCLRDRVAALEKISRRAEATDTEDTPSAITLLGDVEELELMLLKYVVDDPKVSFQPLKWQEIGTSVYVPLWEQTHQRYAEALRGTTFASLPDLIDAPDSLVTAIQDFADRPLSKEDILGKAASVLGVALALALLRQGWTLEMGPGAKTILSKDNSNICPFEVPWQLMTRELTAAAWQQECHEAGIAELSLA